MSARALAALAGGDVVRDLVGDVGSWTMSEAERMRVAAAKVARDHRDDAVRARRTPGRVQIMRFASDESRAEILAEERGENIASEIIEKAILAIPIPEPSPDPVAALRERIKAEIEVQRSTLLIVYPNETIRDMDLRRRERIDALEWALALMADPGGDAAGGGA